MSGLSVPIRGTLAKVWDYELGRADALIQHATLRRARRDG